MRRAISMVVLVPAVAVTAAHTYRDHTLRRAPARSNLYGPFTHSAAYTGKGASLLVPVVVRTTGKAVMRGARDPVGQATARERRNDQVRGRRARRRRFPVATIVATLILVVQVFSYFFTAISSFFSLGVVGSGIAAQFTARGTLTAAGREVVVSSFMLAFGVAALGILVGFLLRKKWAWTAAMTWAAVSLALGLVNYFREEAQYLSMLVGVVLMLALNAAVVKRAFYEEET